MYVCYVIIMAANKLKKKPNKTKTRIFYFKVTPVAFYPVLILDGVINSSYSLGTRFYTFAS